MASLILQTRNRAANDLGKRQVISLVLKTSNKNSEKYVNCPEQSQEPRESINDTSHGKDMRETEKIRENEGNP